ncbi:MAG: hypothetical protein Q9181_006411 [Wetmoreana brouardii]
MSEDESMIYVSKLAPRSQENKRRDLERKLLAQTRAMNTYGLGIVQYKRFAKLFSQHTQEYRIEEARRTNDTARRRAVEKEVEAHRQARARNAERRLLTDAQALPNRGGIPKEKLPLLWKLLGKRKATNETPGWTTEALDPMVEEFVDEAARQLHEEVSEDLENDKTHRGFYFKKLRVGYSKEELEAKGVGWTPNDDTDSMDGMDVEISEDEYEDEIMRAEPMDADGTRSPDNQENEPPSRF